MAAQVFLSHAGLDEQPARQFCELLRNNGISVWFDKDDLKPGDPWMPTLEKAIRESSGMIVYVGRLGVQAWVDREVRLGLELNTKAPSTFRLIPVLGEGSDPASLPPFLSQQQFVDLRDKQHAPEQIKRIVEILRAPSAQSAIPSEYWATHSPFRSLTVFEPQDAWLFFGRDAEAEKLLILLERAPVLAVLGNSGSGKSSLIRAGLIPALRHGSVPWRIAVFRPSNDPFKELAETLPGQLAPELSPAARMELIANCKKDLPSGGEGLRNAIAAVAQGSHTLLVADQFEEIFTLTSDSRLRAQYIDALLAAARIEGAAPVHLVLAIRADFYANCLDHPQLSRLLDANVFNVPRMEPPQLRDAIEKRLALAAATAEPGLIDSLLADVGEEPGNLALLEHALGQLWARGTMTNQAYAQIGRLKGALGRHADDVVQNIPRELQPLVAKVFLDLVQLNEDAQDTRRRVPKNELFRHSSPEQMEQLLDRLADGRLVIVEANSVELSHEALIREWPKLREWLAANREDLRLERGFEDAANQWESSKREPSYLLQGARLAQAEEWFGKHSDASSFVVGFLKACLGARDENRRRELEAARRIRRILYALGVLFVVAAVAALIALRAQAVATAREFAAYSVESLQDDPERSIRLAMQAVNATLRFWQVPVPAAEDALHRAILSSQVRLTLLGHSHSVHGVAFSPDGKRIATASEDKTAKVWDAASGQQLLTLGGHLEAVRSVAFSPDGKRLATASWDQTAKVWDGASGQELLTLRGHSNWVNSVAFSPDGKRIATASEDKTAKVWDVSSGKELLTLRGHSSPVASVAFSPGGDRLATASEDKTAKLWDAASGKELLTLRGHSAYVSSASFSPDGRRVATASEDKTAKLWDATSGQELVTFRGHSSYVVSVAFSPDGKRLATASDDRTAKVWDAASGRELLSFHGHSDAVWSVAFSPDGKRVVTASEDKTAKVWDDGAGQELVTLRGHSSQVLSVAFNPDGHRLATASQDDTAKLWDLASGRELLTLPGLSGGVWSVAFSPDGKRVVSAGPDKTAKVWDAASGQELLTLRGHLSFVYGASFSPDGKRLATASADKTAKVWDPANGRELLNLPGHSAYVLSVAFSSDGKRVATASADKTAKVWDAASGRELLTLRGHSDQVNSVAFSPNGKRIATASADKTAKLWDAASGRELLTLRGHSDQVNSVAFSPDGKRLATASQDKTTKVWDAAGGQELLTLRGHSGWVTGAAFSPDGKRLATASWDQTVQVYAMDIHDLLALARTRVTRSLTPEECKRYFQSETCPALP